MAVGLDFFHILLMSILLVSALAKTSSWSQTINIYWIQTRKWSRSFELCLWIDWLLFLVLLKKVGRGASKISNILKILQMHT